MSRAWRVPHLHVVTDDDVLAGERWLTTAVSVMEAGGPSIALHVRGPRSSGATIYRFASALLPHARRTGTLLVINDRVDVAIAIGADAVHLGQRSLPIAVTRGLFARTTGVGVSCHSGAEVAAAASGGADYAFVGTIFPTPTHPDEAGIGVDGIRGMMRGGGGLPVIGIGGVDAARATSVLAEGAYGVAAVRGVWSSADAGATVAAYLEAIEVGRGRFTGRGSACE